MESNPKKKSGIKKAQMGVDKVFLSSHFAKGDGWKDKPKPPPKPKSSYDF